MYNPMRSRQDFILFLTFLVLLFCIFAWVYLVAPFDGLGNDLALNLIYLVFSAYPVFLLWRVLGFYERDEAPRRIWADFLIGFGLFFVAEVIWSVLNLTMGEVPSPSWADLFYSAGYVFLLAGLLRQYCLVYSRNTKKLAIYTILINVLAIGLVAGFVTWRAKGFQADQFVETLYPVLDLFLGMIALYLLRTFQQGWLARPFWGFLALLVADVIYAISLQSGQYAFVIDQDNLSRLVSDLAYNLAFIIFSIGFWWQYTILKTGSEAEKLIK